MEIETNTFTSVEERQKNLLVFLVRDLQIECDNYISRMSVLADVF